MGQPLPGLLAQGQGTHHAVDAVQGDAAQDERGHAGGEIHAARQATGGHGPGALGGGAGVGQGVAAHGIDHTRPALLAQRFAGSAEFCAVDGAAGLQSVQVPGLGRAAGAGHHGVAQGGQQSDGYTADPAAGTCYQNLAVLRAKAVFFQGQHAQHGGVACGADGHGLAGGEGRGQRHQPVAGHTRLLGQAAAVGFAHTPAIHQDRIAGLPRGVGAVGDGAGKVDARHQRKMPHHGRRAGQGQAVFVVEGGPFHPHGDIPFAEMGVVDILHRSAVAAVVFGDQNAFEHGVVS